MFYRTTVLTHFPQVVINTGQLHSRKLKSPWFSANAENIEQRNSEYGNYLRSDSDCISKY